MTKVKKNPDATSKCIKWKEILKGGVVRTMLQAAQSNPKQAESEVMEFQPVVEWSCVCRAGKGQ